MKKLLSRLFNRSKSYRFNTISDLDLITHSKTRVPILRVIGFPKVIDFYLN